MYQELKTITADLTGPGAQFEIHTIERDGTQLRAFKNAPNLLEDRTITATRPKRKRGGGFRKPRGAGARFRLTRVAARGNDQP